MEKMSHKKVHSLGNIPFSWEDKPGISKVIRCDQDHHYCPVVVGRSSNIPVHDKKVPPPPPFSPLPKRSTSVKGLRLLPQDPFLAAYKECTKTGTNGNKSSSENGTGPKLVRKKKRIIFSCKESSDVRDDNLVRLSNLPALPKDGIRRRREFVYPLHESF